MTRQILQLDLRREFVLQEEGYAATAPLQFDRRCEAWMRWDLGDRTFFVAGVFYGWTAEQLLVHLGAYDPAQIGPWVSRVEGDFNIVVWDRRAGLATAISDRVGAHRLYAHCADGVATFTNRLLDQARLQAEPRLDDTGVFTLLTLQYPLDPHSLLADTFVVALGDVVRCDTAGARHSRYYEPVELRPELIHDEKTAIAALDGALKDFFEQRLSHDSTPLVMLSGGIDSLVMVCYLARLAGERLETLTFAVEGQAQHELEEARMAARYYGTRHHELIVPKADLERLYLKSLSEGDRSIYGGFLDIALAERLAADGRRLDVFRGEDARLHTPTIDLPTLVGLLIHRSGLQQVPVFGTLWKLREAARHWPFRKGRNYIRYLLFKTALRSDLRDYVLEAMTRYALPEGVEAAIPPALLGPAAAIVQARDLDETYRAQVALAYRVQHTEDMHGASVASDGLRTRLMMPFFAPGVVRVLNQLPLSLTLRPLYVGRKKTRSPFPFAEKYVLRKLLGRDAPEALLYRRKAALGATGPYLEALWQSVFVPTVATWGQAVEAQLGGATRAVVAARRRQLMAGAWSSWTLGCESPLTFLCNLTRACQR